MWWYWNCYFWTVFHGMICKVIKRVGNTVVLSLLVYSKKWTLSKDKSLHYKSNYWSSINCFTAYIHDCSIASKIVTRIQNLAWGGYLLSIPSFAPLNKGPLRDYYCVVLVEGLFPNDWNLFAEIVQNCLVDLFLL